MTPEQRLAAIAAGLGLAGVLLVTAAAIAAGREHRRQQ